MNGNRRPSAADRYTVYQAAVPQQGRGVRQTLRWEIRAARRRDASEGRGHMSRLDMGR